ncbi:protein turtle homolog A-like [Eriocheir sinensis]|uniref:protein turtle homolog A-like n=1 Tax=Eriocheir sinensis TaxID=95602 RepID=UPI0021C8EA5A|nr:protein turtle homolog A-like [Eriocheir sinensis]
MSSSRVSVLASRRGHGQRLACTALNPLFPDHPLTDSIVLNVTYPPVASLELGRGASSTVREGEDVYFNCLVDSNPPLYNITWVRQGETIEHAPEAGVLVGGHSLALRGVSRRDAGPYVCLATNAEGEGASPPLLLQVHYAPVCRDGSRPSEVYTAGLGQPVNVSCHVKASPSQVKYSWIFNNSLSSQRLPGEQVLSATEGGSVVEFVAGSHQDYGTLQCWAQNSVGKMSRPCLYHVVPASRPERPTSCAVVNKSYDALVVTCTAGFDGGLRQSFFARVYEAVTGRGQVNMSAPQPRFTLEGLTPKLDYMIWVSARNALGHSPAVRLEAFTYKLAANTMKEEKVMEKKEEEQIDLPSSALSMMVTMSAAVVVMVVAVVVVVVVTARWCLRGSGRQPPATSRSKGFYAPPEQTEDEDLPFEIPAILIDSHHDLIDHDISDQAL